MHALGPTRNVPSLLDAVPITSGLDAQEADATRIGIEIQVNVDALKKEIACHREAITAKHAERERRVATVHEAGRARREDLQSQLEDTKYALSVVNSPALVLPCEVMEEVFDWHMLMGGRLATALLVCKWWTAVAYGSPRLWARISVTNMPDCDRNLLPGSVRCTDLNQLRLVLSRSRSSPLQVEISFFFALDLESDKYCSSTSLMHRPQAFANRIDAVKLILDDQILKRCTCIVLANRFLPFVYQNATILPLLSSVRSYCQYPEDHELQFIHSLINLSPALRHVRVPHSLSPENRGVGLWTERIESYGWISHTALCPLLHNSPSLRALGVIRGLPAPLTLPALQVLMWYISTYPSLRHITAPYLHTLILCHNDPWDKLAERPSAGSISFPNLRIAIHICVPDPTILHMFHTPALEHLSIAYGSADLSPTALLELFDGSAHMPTPKSLHLDCTFTDAALITVLGRLPWLEELQVAGTIAQNTFWEALNPSCNPSLQESLPKSYADERATRILVPHLKVLLVNHPTDIPDIRLTPIQQPEMVQVFEHPDDVSGGGDWTVMQATAVAVARAQAGCPLRTLACWSPKKRAEVLIGSLESLPNRLRCVLLAILWCC
jgi:hypothetical protein